MRKFINCFLLIALLTITFAGCSESDDDDKDANKNANARGYYGGFDPKKFQAPALPVMVKEIRTGTTASTLTTSGRFIAENKAQVISEISEKAMKVHFDIGDYVEEDSVMLELDSEEIELEVKKAEFEVEQTEYQLSKAELEYNKAYADYDKAQKIFNTDPGVYNEAEIKNFKHTADSKKVDLDAQQNALKQIKLALDEAKRNLRNATVKAPISGVVVERLVEENENVSANQKVFEIENTNNFNVEVELTESEVSKVFIGQNALMMNNNGSFVYFGQVTKIAPKVDETKGLLKITLSVFAWKEWRLTSLISTLHTIRHTSIPFPSLTPNCDFPVLGGVMILRPGMFVEVHIALSLHKDVIMVPKEAVNYDQDKPYVFVIGKDMRAQKQYLTLDHEFSTTDSVEVIEGLKVGELVVIRQSDLKNGSLVQIMNSE